MLLKSLEILNGKLPSKYLDVFLYPVSMCGLGDDAGSPLQCPSHQDLPWVLIELAG